MAAQALRRGAARPFRSAAGAVRTATAALGAAYDRLPLFWGVLAINGSILTVAVLTLVLTPFTVSYPVAQHQAVILGVALVVTIAANGILLRGGLKPLFEVLRALEEADLLERRKQLPEVGGAEVRALTRTVNATLDRLEEERLSSTRRVLAALEGERRRVGQELHDEIGQRLTGILLELNPAIAAAPPELRGRLVEIQDDARATLEEVGQLAWQLRPGILDDLGLVAALDGLLSGIEDQADIELRRTLPAALPELPSEVELAIFRIAQEGVTNALRHAEAGVVEVELSVGAELSLCISDDGRGLPVRGRAGPGIQGMRERATLIGGRLLIDSPGALGGVTVTLTLSLGKER